jgi:hypothetical protein
MGSPCGSVRRRLSHTKVLNRFLFNFVLGVQIESEYTVQGCNAMLSCRRSPKSVVSVIGIEKYA